MGIFFDINNKCVYVKYKLINYLLNYYCSKRIYVFILFIFFKKSILKKSIKYRKYEFLFLSVLDIEYRKIRYEFWRDVVVMFLGFFLKGCI